MHVVHTGKNTYTHKIKIEGKNSMWLKVWIFFFQEVDYCLNLIKWLSTKTLAQSTEHKERLSIVISTCNSWVRGTETGQPLSLVIPMPVSLQTARWPAPRNNIQGCPSAPPSPATGQWKRKWEVGQERSFYEKTLEIRPTTSNQICCVIKGSDGEKCPVKNLS